MRRLREYISDNIFTFYNHFQIDLIIDIFPLWVKIVSYHYESHTIQGLSRLTLNSLTWK